jgi:hypothetical protein
MNVSPVGPAAITVKPSGMIKFCRDPRNFIARTTADLAASLRFP